MENKLFSTFEVKTAPSGEFDALISTFDKPDRFGDVVRRGAFRDTIDEYRASNKRVPVVYEHQSENPDMHIGEVEPANLEETAVGLRARGRFYLDEPTAQKVFRQLQRKALNEWSFSFWVTKSKPTSKGNRELLALQIFEIGPCLAGIGHSQTISVKSTTKDARETRVVHEPQLAPYYLRLDLLQRRIAIDTALARGR